MSWIREEPLSWLRYFAVRILKAGPIPQHVAFIMDGNRRFARKKSMARADGHLLGFDKLAETLSWCQDIGVREATLYAFSIENFKRSREEVDGLMELARQKFTRLLDEREKLEKHGICMRVIGNLALLPKDVQQIMAEVVEITKHNNKCFVNICISYTSQDEICTAMRDAVEGVQMGLIRQTDISEDLLHQCLYTNKSTNPDLLVRTSGEVRLSDFLLWQSTFSVLSFLKVLWPEFSFWDLCYTVLHYQTHHNRAEEAKQKNVILNECLQHESDQQCVLAEIETDRLNGVDLKTSLHSRIQQYSTERRKRIVAFLQNLNEKRAKYVTDLYKQQSIAFS